MSWTCPDCGRKYPDSGLSVPRDATAADSEGCEVCWVSPSGTADYERPPAVDLTYVHGRNK